MLLTGGYAISFFHGKRDRSYVGLGDKDKAFEWLETAYRTRNYWLTGLGVDPFYDPLADDPRYHDLLRRMNLPE